MERRNNTRINYVDGSSKEACVTLHMRGQAEAYAKARGWGSSAETPLRQFQYAAYCAARRDGGVTMPFEQWQDDVADITTITDPPDESGDEAPNPPISSTNGSAEG